MPHKTTSIIKTVVLIFGLFLSVPGAWGGYTYDLPPLPPPDEYGNVVINRTSTRNGIKPVIFSHWKHRVKYTCRVCHSELDFNMRSNTTEIREILNRQGKFCGACHNGKIAFKLNGNCEKCHSGDIRYGADKFEVFYQKQFPHTQFGNGINWDEALKQELIKPLSFLKNKSEDIPFEKKLNIDADWGRISPAIFTHKTHAKWLECSNCHPDIFNIKKKSTAQFTMANILKGKFCGACHLSVAFPMNDCNRCHPGISMESK